MSALHDAEIGDPGGPDVRLSLPARAENVAVVRQALAGLADALQIDPALAADMKIAVTEACTNAVLHAYDGGEGSLEVTIAAGENRLGVSVRDRGPGFRPLPSNLDGAPVGFGLALIASLADSFAIQGGAGGTEVQMAFVLTPEDGADPPPPGDGQLRRDLAPPPEHVVIVKARPGPLVAPVLGRVISLLAARADFSIDRLSDTQLVSDAIAQHSGPYAIDGHVTLELDELDQGLELLVGPLIAGGGERLVQDTDLPGIGRLLEALSDSVGTEPVRGAESTDAEMLRVQLSRPNFG